MIAIPPDGENAARRFYCDLLGLTELSKPATLAKRGGLWLRTGSIELHLGIDPNFVPAQKAHVAFRVDALAEVAARLQDHGYPSAADTDLPGFARFYVDDPFGNRIEVLQPLDKG